MDIPSKQSTQLSQAHKGFSILSRRSNTLWEGLYPTKIYQRFRTLCYEEKKRHLAEVIKQLDQYSLQIKSENQEEIVQLRDLTYQQILNFDRIFDIQSTNSLISRYLFLKTVLNNIYQKSSQELSLELFVTVAQNQGNPIRQYIFCYDYFKRLFGELKDYGLLLQFLLELWMKIEEIENFEESVDVHISFYQYKGDEFFDLLVASEASLDVYEGLDGEVKMVGLTKLKAKNLLDCLKATKQQLFQQNEFKRVAIINSANNDQNKETNKMKKNKQLKAHFFITVEVDYYQNYPDKSKALKSTFTFLEFATVSQIDLYNFDIAEPLKITEEAFSDLLGNIESFNNENLKSKSAPFNKSKFSLFLKVTFIRNTIIFCQNFINGPWETIFYNHLTKLSSNYKYTLKSINMSCKMQSVKGLNYREAPNPFKFQKFKQLPYTNYIDINLKFFELQ